jgi:hypothetical protein
MCPGPSLRINGHVANDLPTQRAAAAAGKAAPLGTLSRVRLGREFTSCYLPLAKLLLGWRIHNLISGCQEGSLNFTTLIHVERDNLNPNHPPLECSAIMIMFERPFTFKLSHFFALQVVVREPC